MTSDCIYFDKKHTTRDERYHNIVIINAMTELKEKKKSGKFTPSETNMRNSMLKKLHESGDFDRCVLVLSMRGSTEHCDLFIQQCLLYYFTARFFFV